MAEIQAISPVYLPKRIGEDESPEDYDTSVSQNENLLNQNLSMLYDQIVTLADLANSQQQTIEELNRTINLLRGT